MTTIRITWRTETRHTATVTMQRLADLLGRSVAEVQARTRDVADALTDHALTVLEDAGGTSDDAETTRFGLAIDGAPLPGSQRVNRYDERDIGAVLNAVADDVLDVTDAGDEGLRDAINLMVNAALTYLRHGWRDHDPAAAPPTAGRRRRQRLRRRPGHHHRLDPGGCAMTGTAAHPPDLWPSAGSVR